MTFEHDCKILTQPAINYFCPFEADFKHINKPRVSRKLLPHFDTSSKHLLGEQENHLNLSLKTLT